LSFLLTLSGRIDALNARLGAAANWCVLIACLLCAGNAVSRYAFDLSSNAWLEAQWYLFAFIVMIGASHTLARNEHVRVDLVYSHVGERTQAWIDLVGTTLFLLPAVALLAWLSWPVFSESFAIGEVSNNAGGLLRWPVKLLLPLGFALLTMQGLSELIKRAAVLTGHRVVVPPHYERPLQ